MIRCFYHSADLDGHCSGAIIKYRFPDAVMYPINYGDAFPFEEIQPDDEVYMVDFALQPWSDMVRLTERCNLYWIDHHKSAIDSFDAQSTEDQGKFKNIYALTYCAACELTWKYLFRDRPVPHAVKLLSLYDSWTYQGHKLEDMVLPFQMRMRMEELDPKDWDGLVEKGGTGPKWHNLFMQEDLGYWIREGRLLLRYDEANKAKYAKTYAFETELHVDCNHEYIDGVDPSFAMDEHVKTCPMGHYKAIAVNLGHTNSKVFDAILGEERSKMANGIEPYDLMITFVRRRDKLWTVSLYSTKPDVDCGAIAKTFGGGGHKGAAGFQCEELPFEY